MRLEILAKRIAEKSNCPQLQPVLLGEQPVTDIPLGDCFEWTGAFTGGSQMFRLQRQGWDARVTRTQKTPTIQYEGKRWGVARLVYTLIFKPEDEFRLVNQCGNSRCINPHHWKPIEPKVDEEAEEAPPLPSMSMEWEPAEVEELLDILLLEENPQTWEDVISNPLMEGVPPPMLHEVLLEMRLERLCKSDTLKT